jgi:hypothetical protein
MLNRLDRPSIGRPNFNHWFYLPVNLRRRQDAQACLRARPAEYARSVALNLVGFFSPSTRWHPWDQTPRSPHAQHRQVLGGYEAAYDTVVHRFPCAPVGLYALVMPFALAWAVRRARALRRAAGADARARGALLIYCLLQIGYVIAASIFLSYGEMARYRYLVEGMLWLILALGVRRLVRFAAAEEP